MATLCKLPKDLAKDFEEREGEDFMAFMVRSDKAFDKLVDDATRIPEGTVKGHIVSFPVADNYANYLVVSEKPLKLAHLPVGDGYSVNDFTIRGMRLQDVQHKVAGSRIMAAMFAKK